MADTSYPCRDYGEETDLATYGIEQSIQNEIQRGEKLRQQKFLERDKGFTSNFSRKPSLARSLHPAKRQSSPSPKRNNGLDSIRKRAKSNSPTHFNLGESSTALGRGSRSSSVRRPVCSMRISQLAEPTKRQCIETWRNKANVLPGFMVHRLKQQIMDQKPIVQISDAITCFKYDKTDKTSTQRRPQRKINKEAMKLREFEENQNLSVIFGNKLAEKLIRPTDITLIPRLRTMSSVISSEICYVMKDTHKPVDEATHERMVREISDKVTIWIAGILEDTTEKLLEEDLRAKKMNDRIPVTVNGEVITLMDTMVEKETELEEQEGPALDVLEDVVDNVLDICAPSITEDTYDDSDRDNLSTDYLSVSSGNNVDTDTLIQLVDDDDTIRKHLMNQLLDIIGTIKSNENLDFDDSIEGHPNIEEKQSTSYLPLPDSSEQNKKDRSHTSDSFESITSQYVDKDLTVSLPSDGKVMTDEENSSNVSDTLEILSEEEKNKKVTFSHDNIGSLMREMEQLESIKSSEESYLHTEKYTEQVTSETSLSSSRRGVYDSWPNDLPTNVVKPSASVNKSITSLGRILESDEKNLLSPEVEVTSEQLTPQTPEIIELLDNSENAYNHYTDAKDSNDGLDGIVTQELINSDDKINLVLKKDTDADIEEHNAKQIVEIINRVNPIVDDTHKDLKVISEIEYINQEEHIVEDQEKELTAVPETIFKCEITKKDHISEENIIQYKDKDLKSMNKICISHDSTNKQSLVSVMLFELQKHGAKLQDFVAVREQSRSYISKMCVQCECPKSNKNTQNKQPSSKMYHRHLRLSGTAAVLPNKFDYRVQPKTAPAWLTSGQGDLGGNFQKKIVYPGKKSAKDREREIRKWCDDLDNILMNLSKWRSWLEYITNYITTLKHKAEFNMSKTDNSSKIETVDRLKPPRTIDKDVMWTKLNQRAKGGLKLYRNDEETIKFKILPAPIAVKQYKGCVCTKQTKRLRVSSPTKK